MVDKKNNNQLPIDIQYPIIKIIQYYYVYNTFNKI